MRVVAGAARGRRLLAPPGSSTRPTSDRAREGLFSSLQSLLDLDGARVLDLYAGSGALGLEALSRGAGTVRLVEDDPVALTALRANVASVGLPGAEVVAADVDRFLAGSVPGRIPGRIPGHVSGGPTPHDLVVADPPYDLGVDGVLAALEPWLAEDGVVVIERATRTAVAWPSWLEPLRTRVYGAATLHYARRP